MDVTRRDMLKGAGIFAAGLAATGAVSALGCSTAAEEAAPSYLPETWDGETDILIVGCGDAGLSAAITAAGEGLGECLILEAAPEGREGGNSRVCAQGMISSVSVEGLVKYQTFLNGPYVIEEDLMQAWAEGLYENTEWLESIGVDAKPFAMSAEWPDAEGAEDVRYFLADGVMGSSSLWNNLWRVAGELGVTVQTNSRALELIHDPETKEVFGVKADVNGEMKCYKARKAVVLACGGFECDEEMVAGYSQIGHHEILAGGTPYNRGDGLRMTMALGAKMWHMNNFALISGYCIPNGNEENPRGRTGVSFKTKDFIYVGADAKRFCYEEIMGLARHGKYTYGGCATNLMRPVPTYAIFGQACYDAGDVVAVTKTTSWNGIFDLNVCNTNQDLLDKGVLQKADTLEELAEKLGLDGAALAATVTAYNANAVNGGDPEYHRGTAVEDGFDYMSVTADSTTGDAAIMPFELPAIEGPFYGMKLYQGMMNTMGGPKRSAKGEILDVNENPIPRLYGAGEFGVIYAYNYNGGGNVAEAMSSGRLAAREAGKLEAWDAVE